MRPRVIVVCHVPLVFVFTWRTTVRVWARSLARTSMPGMFPENTTA
jgi:hypothetical protein